MEKMRTINLKRGVALLLALCMTLSLLPVTVLAADTDQPQSQLDAAPTEDASAQLGAYTPLAEPSEQEDEPPAEDPAREPASSGEASEAPAEETEPTGAEQPAEETEPTGAEQPAGERGPARPVLGNMANEGRTGADQQVLNVDGTEYILIGTKQQLQALDYYPQTASVGDASGDQITESRRYDVTGPIWRVTEKRDSYLSSNWYESGRELVYPGDNNLTGSFADYPLYGENDCITDPNHGPADTHKLGQTVVTRQERHLLVDYDMERDHYVTGTLEEPNRDVLAYDYGKYSPRSNYVIFRDIDLRQGLEAGEPTPNWTPLMFYGRMYGVKGSALTDTSLETAVREIAAGEDSLDYSGYPQPTIYNVSVDTALEPRYSGQPSDRSVMDPDQYVGVGFFASVTSARPGADSGFSHVRAEVRNLALNHVSITNGYSSIQVNETLVSWLTTNLGSGVGYLLDFLLRLLTGKSGTDFADSVSDLLTARAKDPTNFATGSFVGRVYGDVLIENCDVFNAEIHSDHSYVGGFVGYSVGAEQYDLVSQSLGAILKLLSTILNLIPGLGLGDLITIVQNVLPLNTLIPVGYLNPHIEDCRLTGLTGSLGPASLSWTFRKNTVEGLINDQVPAQFNGGFIGCKVATVMINCAVRDSAYTVFAREYGGGFAGLARDAVIQELLTDLGVEVGVIERLARSGMELQSVQVRCEITDSDVTVRGENYLGGFNGAMTNAYSVNNRMVSRGKTLSVQGTGNFVGGYAGIATLGWGMSMGKTEVTNTSLLSTLKDLVTSVTGSYGDELLSLLGVGQTEILGLQFDYRRTEGSGSGASVTGYDFAGGLVGKADALIMTGTTAANLSRISFFRHGELTAWDVFPDMPKTGAYTVTYHEMDGSTAAQTVTAADNYTITLPAHNDAGNYKFVGWITDHYDHSIGEPSGVLQAGEPYLVTRDVTFNALYSIEGDTVYELVSGTPSNWEEAYENYVITYGRDENMVVLAGLEAGVGGTSYESADSGGARTLSQIRAEGGDSSLFTISSGVLISKVPDAYLFEADKVLGQTDTYFRSVAYQDYLGLILNKLSSYNLKELRTQWRPQIDTDLNILFKSAYDTDDYLTYDPALGYFRLGTLAEAKANKLYIWGKNKLPTRYTTVEAGAELPLNSDEIELDDSAVGVFAKVRVKGLEQVRGHKYVGGLAGLAGTANVSGLLNDTIGVGDFRKFEFRDIEAVGGTELTEGSSEYGLRVLGDVPDKALDTNAGYYVGGGVGMAIGGDLLRLELSRLERVQGVNCAGGFGGCVGPGDLVSTGGLNVQLLGLSLLSAEQLLSVGSGVRTAARLVTVRGVPAGFTVKADGENSDGSQETYTAGGFYGKANSSGVRDCHVENLLGVEANMTDGRAGGFVGVSKVGGLAEVSSGAAEIKGLLSAGNLLGAVGYLIPEFKQADTSYVDGGYVEAAWAGGFAADFQSGTVDNGDNESDKWYAVYNIDRVTGTRYAGGFAAKLYSGALADSRGGISILGGVTGVNIQINDLVSLVQTYVPAVRRAGVQSLSTASDPAHPGFTVECGGYDDRDSTTGAAGGFVGYASGAQISYCDVLQLRHTAVTEPEALEGRDGTPYFTRQSGYAVSGARYGGGYAGFLDIGSAASLGGGLGILGETVSAANVLKALDVVISTVEHSTVYGGPGGFAVKASAYTGGTESESGSGAAQRPARSAKNGAQAEEDRITVYVTDKTPGTQQLWGYCFNSVTDTGEPGGWPGQALEYRGTDENGFRYYSFAIDRSLYDRVIFHDNYGHQTPDEACLHLEDATTLANLREGVMTVSANTNNGWYVSVEEDIWPDTEAVASCRGSYKHYTSVRGEEKYVETVSDESASHSFGPGTPIPGAETHSHVCAVCGYLETEACTYYNGICTECGRVLTGAVPEGKAGGFVGWMRGAHIQDSHADNFSHIIGQIAAGGYAGEIEPGDVGAVAEDASVLGGLVEAGKLLSVAQDFVPSIRNSTTSAIPCGGVVRADAFSDSQTQRGMAGGYVGHNLGGQIWGNNDARWLDEADPGDEDHSYTGPKSECAAIRILSVYGAEYAGGFTGLMEAGSTAGTGSVSLLFGLVRLDGLLDALKVAYPTEENTAVCGPLARMTPALWNSWVEYVGVYGGYGMHMEQVEENISAEDFAAMLEQYVYGYHVAAGREEFVNDSLRAPAGCAGGYVGSMRSGTITNGQAYDVKQVRAMRNAGGFAGDMKTGSVARLGQMELATLELNLGALLAGALDVFVPVVKSSSVHGYQSGLTVLASGSADLGCGNAGGYAGSARGVQIWGKYRENITSIDPDTGNEQEVSELVGEGCAVENLKKVQGSRYAGGYLGILGSGSVAELGTNVSEENSPLQELLDAVIELGGDNTGSLLSAVNATVSTVRYAQIDAADPERGFTVGGWSETAEQSGESTTVKHLPLAAGGFVGSMEGAIVGNNKEKNESAVNIYVRHLRGVEGRYYAGGFAGAAGSGSALTAASNRANLLSLLNLGEVSALDMFRPYIYNSNVEGVEEGFTARAFDSEAEGVMSSRRYSGCAGGFAGAVLNGTVEHAAVLRLSGVKALNYGGGFVGFTGKNGVVDVDSIGTSGVLQNLLSAQAGIGDVLGSTFDRSSVTGVSSGYTVEAGHFAEPEAGVTPRQPIAGGYVGFGDLAQIDHSAAANLKYVSSDGAAGGFIGQTSLAYLVEGEVGGYLTTLVVSIANLLLNRILNVDDLSRLDLAQIDLGILQLDLLTEGDLVYVDLLGLKIGIGFQDAHDEDGKVTIRIGDSSISLNLNEGQVTAEDDSFSNVTVQLFRTNHSNVKNSSVAGISEGFDVFGGGASQTEAAAAGSGPAGGFVGLNEESILENCRVEACDVIRGAADQVGPFSGSSIASSVYESYSISALEGSGNSYQKTGESGAVTLPYDPNNRLSGLEEGKSLIRDALGGLEKIVLIRDTALAANLQTMLPETAEMQNPCLPTVDLTVHKVWDDMDGALGLRADPEHPVTLSFSVWRLTNGANPEKLGDYTLSAADADPFTGNVWTKVIRGLPATNGSPEGVRFDDPAFERYSYYVTEAELSGYAYISGVAYADADPADKLRFDGGLRGGYAAKLVNQAVPEQTVVVDYGLPVSISLVDYLMRKYNYPAEGYELAGILPVSGLTELSRYSVDASPLNARLGVQADAQTGAPTPESFQQGTVYRYGSFQVPARTGETPVTRLRYVPGSMQFDRPVQVAAVLRSPEGSYYGTRLTVVPAANIYYEDDFIRFSPEWEDAGSAEAGEQDEDRPGADLLDMDSVYGYDSRYASGSTYSLGSAKRVTVRPDMESSPTASFTFTGTGFDLLAVTDQTTGFMTVELYRGAEATGTPMKKWAVDSFYGLERQDNGYIRHLLVWDETNALWRVAKTPFPEMTDAEAAGKVNTTEDGVPVLEGYRSTSSEDHSSYVVYRKNYVWVPGETNNTLYQVPLVSTRNLEEPLEYGTYTVKLIPRYLPFFDHSGAQSYDLYVDGVRVYGPAQDLDEDYYLPDHEGWPQFIELRQLLLEQGSLGEDGSQEQRLVYVDGMVPGDLESFRQYGPNNEIYLQPDQAIAFRLQKGESARVDRIHISAKRVFTGSAQLLLLGGDESPDRSNQITLNTASECYYDLSSVVKWREDGTSELIVISNNGGSGTISLRNLKITYEQEVGSQSELVTVAAGGAQQAAQALRLLDRSAALPIVLDDDPAFLGASISLESDFSLHFYIPAALFEGKTNPYLVFTKPTAEGSQSFTQYDYVEQSVNGTLCRRYSFPHLSAAEMGTEVTARLFYNAEGTDHMSLSLGYSVRQYALNMLEKTEDPALRQLLADMLNYGAEAQAYFGLDPEHPVNGSLTETQRSWATQTEPALESHKSLISNPLAKAWFEGCSLSLERCVEINYYLDLSDTGLSAGETALELSWQEADGGLRTVLLDGAAFEPRALGGRSLYVAALTELNAAQMRTVVSARLIRKADGARLSDTMRYSVESYAHSKSADAALAGLLLAMMKYGDAAKAYFSRP